MTEQLQVKQPLPTAVSPKDGESCQSVIERIAEENIQRYGIAAGIYAKTDYDLSEDYQSDLWRMYKTIAMSCDALSEMQDNFEDRFEIAKLSVLSQTGFYRFWTERLNHLFEGSDDSIEWDVKNLKQSLHDTKHNAGILINMLHRSDKLGTHGKDLLIQNVSNLHDRLETIANRIERVQGGESVDDVIND